MEERFRKRLTKWKRHYLYKDGMITLIKSTLSSLPIYFMSLFVISRKVSSRLEKIQRDFLWGNGALEKMSHLVNWNLVRVDKEGSLGICNRVVLNKALLGKWSWRFVEEGAPLKTNHYWEVWRRGKGMVFKRNERRLWCGGAESHQK